MKLTKTFAALLAAALVVGLTWISTPPASAGPVATTISTVTVKEHGRSFSARLVQPTKAADHAYPVVGFGHGFAQSSFRYDSTLRALAGRGYVVIAPNTQTSLFPSHSAFADDLVAAVDWAADKVPSADPEETAVVGHSMGGGAALLAADRDSDLAAVATLAAAETSPSAVKAAAGIDVPALFVVGSQDGVVKPSTTRRMYEAKPSPASWVSITGGYHCGFLDSSSFFGLGCDSGSISRSTQLAITTQVLGDWLDQQLKGDPAGELPSGVVGEST